MTHACHDLPHTITHTLSHTHQVEPTWRLEDTFVLGSQGAMETDALSGTHTVVIGDQDDPGSLLPPAEIEGLFDSITYTKGGSLLKVCPCGCCCKVAAALFTF